MPFTQTSSGPVHWTVEGEGEPLVLLHGLGGDVSFWEAERTALADRFRVVSIDLRGSGRTPAARDGHTMDDLADDVAAVLADQQLVSAHVLGFSMGGLVAQAFALRHPAMLRRLVLASTFAVMNRQSRMFLDAVLDVYEGGATPKQMFDLICPWLFSADFLADPANDVFLHYPDDEPEEQSLDDWRKLYLAQRAFDANSGLPAMTAPTLVIAGGEDRLATVEDAEALVRSVSSAVLHVLPGKGHLVNVEASDEFIDLVRSHFLVDHSSH
ncbi:alpha/beta fold hydrolase [Streptomyces sp. NPDC054861]